MHIVKPVCQLTRRERKRGDPAGADLEAVGSCAWKLRKSDVGSIGFVVLVIGFA